eukprot:7901287-Alexandrium_andersonii.AAC.1
MVLPELWDDVHPATKVRRVVVCPRSLPNDIASALPAGAQHPWRCREMESTNSLLRLCPLCPTDPSLPGPN